MITLTGFADEISADLDEQLDVLASEGISHIEFRGVWGKNVLRLSDEEAAAVKKRLGERGFSVSSIGSPIGKIGIADDFGPHLDDFNRAIRLAHFYGAPYIRIFSFFLPNGEDPANYRDAVMDRMLQLTRIAEQAGVTLLHENESHIYGDNGERCLDILQTCQSERLRCAFDPANFVQCKVKPMTEAYPLLSPYLTYVHIKDAVAETGKIVPAGDGDGELRELIAALKERNYSGFLSLEPHLAAAERFQGFSGPDLFVTAIRALKKLLTEAELSWN